MHEKNIAKIIDFDQLVLAARIFSNFFIGIVDSIILNKYV